MSFKDALRSKEFVVTAELSLTSATTKESLINDARSLCDSVDGFILTDNQYGQPHMAPSYAAAILQEKGFPPILQISCRNRNRIALMGELLGAKVTGIDTVYLVDGAVLPEGYAPRPVAVMDTDANELIGTAKLMNEQEELIPGSEILIGASATVHDPSPEKNPGKLLAKADAGAKLMITQICMNNEVLRRYMEFLVNHKLLQRFSVIVSVAIVTSPELAQWLKDNRLRTIIHDDLIERLAAADDGEIAAVEFTRDLVQDIQTIPGVAGINFAAASELHLIPEILSSSGGPR